MTKQLKVKLGLDNSAFKSGLSQSQNELKQFGSTLRNAISFAGGQMLVEGLKRGFKETVIEGLNFNDTLQQANLSFKTMLGSAEAANDQVSELWDLAKKTPFEFPELLTASKRMIAFKFSAKDVADMLTTIGDASAALSLGSDGINRITLALGQMQMKGKVSGEEMRQLAEAGINAWEYLADATGKTVAETQKLVSKGLVPAREAIAVILSGMNKDFGGGMAELSKNYSGLMATLKDSTRDAMGTVMQPAFEELTNNILPGAIEKIQSFTDEIKRSGIKEGIASLFPEENAENIKNMLDGITASFKMLLDLGGKAIDVVGDAGQKITDNWNTVATIITGVVSAWIAYKAAVTAAAVAQGLMNVAANMNPYVLLASALIGVTAAAAGYAIVNEKMRQQSIDTAIAKAQEIEETKNLVNEYYDLRAVTEKTVEQKEKLDRLEQQLIAKLPEATNLINDQTISYAQQKAILEELIATKNKDALMSGALSAESDLPRLKQELKDMKDLEKSLENDLKNVSPFQDIDYPSLPRLFKDPTAKDIKRELSDTIKTRQEIEEQVRKSEEAIKAYDKFIREENIRELTAPDAQRIAKELKKQRNEAQKALNENKQKSDRDSKNAAEEAAENLRNAMTKASGDTESALKKMQDDLHSFVSDLRSQRDEFASFGSMFERNVIEKFSPGKIQSRLNRMLKQMQEWRQNMADLMQKGVGEDILENLRAMGLEGAGIAAGLNRMDIGQLQSAIFQMSQIRSIATEQAVQTVTYRHELDVTGTLDVRGYTDDGQLENIKQIVGSDLAEQINTNIIPLSGNSKRGVVP